MNFIIDTGRKRWIVDPFDQWWRQYHGQLKREEKEEGKHNYLIDNSIGFK